MCSVYNFDRLLYVCPYNVPPQLYLTWFSAKFIHSEIKTMLCLKIPLHTLRVHMFKSTYIYRNGTIFKSAIKGLISYFWKMRSHKFKEFICTISRHFPPFQKWLIYCCCDDSHCQPDPIVNFNGHKAPFSQTIAIYFCNSQSSYSRSVLGLNKKRNCPTWHLSFRLCVQGTSTLLTHSHKNMSRRWKQDSFIKV